MNMELRNEKKKRGLARFISSFKWSFQGIAYAFKKEQSVMVMVISTFTAIALGVILKVSLLDWFFIFISIALVLGTELLNTAIEATIDLLSPDYNPLAKIAKDTASASVFIYSVIAFIIGCCIFIPHIIELAGRK